MKTKEEYKQDLRNLFEKVLKEKGITKTQLAQILNSKQQIISEKIKNASWRYVDVVEALNMLGYDLLLISVDEKEKIEHEDTQEQVDVIMSFLKSNDFDMLLQDKIQQALIQQQSSPKEPLRLAVREGKLADAKAIMFKGLIKEETKEDK